MKNLLLLALLAMATVEASASTKQDGQTPSGTMTKEQRKAARQAKQPQVYKGSVAERRRVLTDANGAENDSDNGDDTSTKSGKKKSKSKY